MPVQYIKLLHLLHDAGPLLVHCSAGIGRTGALIAIDVALNLINRDLKVRSCRVLAVREFVNHLCGEIDQTIILQSPMALYVRSSHYVAV